MSYLFQVVLLGIVEGLTEFLPVSSTGHLLMFGQLIDFQGPPGKVFEVVIQLGAILAVCLAYAPQLWRMAVDLPRDPRARRFVLAVGLGFLPAAVAGLALYTVIKTYLFSPYVAAVALVIGGAAILVIERIRPRPRIITTDAISPARGFAIGLCQVLSLVPGVSRAGATILGGVMLGIERRAATEFSFFLAIPTMLAATLYDLYSSWSVLSAGDMTALAVGFFAAFVTALAIIRTMLWFVSRFGFAPFGWYRIVFGLLFLAALWTSAV